MGRKRFFGLLGRSTGGNTDRGASRSVWTRRLTVEPLEERRLLSVNAGDLDVFALHSYEGATAVLYLDFDGHTTSGTEWNRTYNAGKDIVTPAFSFDDDLTRFSIEDCSAIYEVWRRVAEDYLPFKIDVTTEKPVGDNCSAASAQRVVIGGSCTDWYLTSSGASGVGYIDTYGTAQDIPCFVFSENCGGNFKIIADAASHESGHTFGLRHDGCTATTPAVEYYPGLNGWGPIMGAPYYQELTQWSKGEYDGAANISNGVIQYDKQGNLSKQDDLTVIATKIASVNKIADGYRADDYDDGMILTNATISLVDGSGAVSGIIGRTGDVDRFCLKGTGANLDFWVGGCPDVTNLDVLVTMYDSDGGFLAEYDPTDTLYCAFTFATCVDATYYLSVTGTGKTVDSVEYYSNYGSLGAYDLIIGTGPALVVTTELDTIASDGKLSLREAILLAAGNGVIRFDTALLGKTIALSGDALLVSRSVKIDATALITTDSAGETVWGMTLNAGTFSQIFWIQPQYYQFDGETANPGSALLDVTLLGLELTGGRVVTESENVLGGAVFCNGGTLRIESCRFYDNGANRSVRSDQISGGGAIYTGGNLTIHDCVFENNTAVNGFGGAILAFGGVTTIEGGRFVSNSAEQGGAIFFNGVCATIDGCVLVENEAKYGGGFIAYASVSFTDCDLSRNRAICGGGLYICTGVSVTFDLGTIGGNEAKSLEQGISAGGGGVCNFGTFILTGSVVAGNAVFGVTTVPNDISTGLGGGIYSVGTLTLTNVTCAGNFAQFYGGGVFNTNTFSATNSILYGNTDTYSSGDFYTIRNTAFDYSLYGSGKGNVSGSNLLSGEGVNAGFILFTAINAYTDWTKTLYLGWNLRLATGSAAVDKGNDALALDSKKTPLTADLDNVPRKIDGDDDNISTVDMGAFEYITVFSVTVQAGCDFWLGGKFDGKTVWFDLNGDGDCGDFSANGLVSALPFAQYSGKEILAEAVDSNGNVSEPFHFVCTVISRPNVWFVHSAAFCDDTVLKLAVDALSDSAVVRWTLDWGDESSLSVFDSVHQTLQAVHYYSTDVSAVYRVELTAEFADSTTETVTLLHHAINGPDSLFGFESAGGFVRESDENVFDAADSAARFVSNVDLALQPPAEQLERFMRLNDFFPLKSSLNADTTLPTTHGLAAVPLCLASESDSLAALDALFAEGETEFFTPSDESDEPDAAKGNMDGSFNPLLAEPGFFSSEPR